MRRAAHVSFPRRQQGATLVVALLILVLIMMIGITAISTSNTQFKLAGNLQFEDGAMNNAESAVSAAERWLSTGTNYTNAAFTAFVASTNPAPESTNATAGLLPRTDQVTVRASRDARPFSLDWSLATQSVSVIGDTQRYYIELMSVNNRLQGSSQVVGGRASSGCNQVNTYLITGRGTSARGAVKFVQSYYSVLSCA